jgi:hypothetical protein
LTPEFLTENPQMDDPDPEPCDDCDTGISWWPVSPCFDGVRRCMNCAKLLIERMGWDDPPPPPEPRPCDPVPPSPPPLPPQKVSRKVLLQEQLEREKEKMLF